MAVGQTSELNRALSSIPHGLFVLTAAYEQTRCGVLVKWVQPCAADPPMVMLAMSKGLAIEPLIRDSRSFALCLIGADDRFLQAKFAAPPSRHDDPFVAIPTRAAPSGSPIITRAAGWYDCELVRHVDLETSFALYVGRVMHAMLHSGAKPAVQVACRTLP